MRPNLAKYTVGDGLRSVCEVRNPQTGVLYDPDDIVMRLKNPAGTESTVTPTRLSEGVYEAQVVLDSHGIWHRQWKVSGSTTGVGEGSVLVDPSNFTP